MSTHRNSDEPSDDQVSRAADDEGGTSSPEGVVPLEGADSLPDEHQWADWQSANRSWWELNPMRYDWNEEIGLDEFSSEFFTEIDHRFFENVRPYMPWDRIPFDPLIDFDSLRTRDVLEIGTGSGSHAQLLATYARSFTGIDITDYAVTSTSERLRLSGLEGTIRKMDAERMDFSDDSFDFVWAWGVIHHSANTLNVLREMKRVLRPNGGAVVMVYHKSFWNYQVVSRLRGLTKGKLLAGGALDRWVQDHTDGAIARYYSKTGWRDLVSDLFAIEWIRIYGAKAELIPLRHGRLKDIVGRAMPDSLARLFTNRLNFGSFLVSRLDHDTIPGDGHIRIPSE